MPRGKLYHLLTALLFTKNVHENNASIKEDTQCLFFRLPKNKTNPSIYYLYQQRDNFQLCNETRNILHHKINKATYFKKIQSLNEQRIKKCLVRIWSMELIFKLMIQVSVRFSSKFFWVMGYWFRESNTFLSIRRKCICCNKWEVKNGVHRK